MSERPYSIPLRGIAELSYSIFLNPHRNLLTDSIRLLATLEPHPLLTGTENLPRNTPFVIVANHYQRNGLWIGWPGMMLVEAIGKFRPIEIPLRIMVTDAQRVEFQGKARAVPFSGWFLKRVAQMWGMLRMPGDERDTAGRAAALKAALRVLKNGEPLLFFPEGDRGSASGLIEALPGTGTFLALASRFAKIIPVGFWEVGALLRGNIGAPITVAGDDAAIRAQVMDAIRQTLPAH